MPETITDLTNCDREPIHTPGSIQAHGCLLACSADGSRILRSSSNCVTTLGLRGEPQGKSLAECFDNVLVHDLLNALAKSSEPRRPGLLRSARVNDQGQFDIAVHNYNGTMIIEFEPTGNGVSVDPLEIARSLIAKTHALTDLRSINARLPRYLQGMLGYDRVMIYEFAADGSGKVTGEARRPDLESFLGQHFPAADIPKQARVLYLQNTIRIVADASGPSSAIEPVVDASGAPLDLSFAHLRSVSPIHLEYLRNMGVGASMSISIIVGGQLWGLIACHHYAPKALTMSQRIAAELFGDFFSLHLTSLRERQRVEATIRVRGALDQLLADLSFHQNVSDSLRNSLADFAMLVNCDGVGLWLDGIWTSHGSAPPKAAVPKLARLASVNGAPEVMCTHAIAQRWPDASEFAASASGMMVVPLSIAARDFMFFFRREKVQTLNWAGDPNKTYGIGPNGDRLTPRQSFAVWKQAVEGQSDPWSDDDRVIGNALLLGMREIVMRNVEAMAAERKKAEVRQRVLNDELNHRVKNILALIKSLVNHPVAAGTTLEDFVKGLKGRILALSHAHDQVVRSDGGGSLSQLLRAELSPYSQDQIAIEGDDVGLDARAYSVMALVIHELSTNAAKYGALSSAKGRLLIRTVINENGDCVINWIERGGPEVRQSQQRGFGSVLLARSIPFDLQGTSDIELKREGLEATLMVPAKFLSSLKPEVIAVPPAPSSSPHAVDFSEATVLLLEDQLVIALDAEEMLMSIGIPNVITLATAEEALRQITRVLPDMAVLDVNLGSGTSIPVAEEFFSRGVPFVFATGYGDSVMIPDKLRSVPVVRKPYSAEALKSALQQVSRAADGEAKERNQTAN